MTVPHVRQSCLLFQEKANQVDQLRKDSTSRVRRITTEHGFHYNMGAGDMCTTLWGLIVLVLH